MKNYEITRNKPVAKFYYQGTHSHPVRRTVLIISSNRNSFTGYELREGNIERDFDDSPVKSYTKSKVATVKEIDSRLSLRRKAVNKNESTLKRDNLLDLIKYGI